MSILVFLLYRCNVHGAEGDAFIKVPATASGVASEPELRDREGDACETSLPAAPAAGDVDLAVTNALGGFDTSSLGEDSNIRLGKGGHQHHEQGEPYRGNTTTLAGATSFMAASRGAETAHPTEEQRRWPR